MNLVQNVLSNIFFYFLGMPANTFQTLLTIALEAIPLTMTERTGFKMQPPETTNKDLRLLIYNLPVDLRDIPAIQIWLQKSIRNMKGKFWFTISNPFYCS